METVVVVIYDNIVRQPQMTCNRAHVHSFQFIFVLERPDSRNCSVCSWRIYRLSFLQSVSPMPAANRFSSVSLTIAALIHTRTYSIRTNNNNKRVGQLISIPWRFFFTELHTAIFWHHSSCAVNLFFILFEFERCRWRLSRLSTMAYRVHSRNTHLSQLSSFVIVICNSHAVSPFSSFFLSFFIHSTV